MGTVPIVIFRVLPQSRAQGLGELGPPHFPVSRSAWYNPKRKYLYIALLNLPVIPLYHSVMAYSTTVLKVHVPYMNTGNPKILTFNKSIGSVTMKVLTLPLYVYKCTYFRNTTLRWTTKLKP